LREISDCLKECLFFILSLPPLQAVMNTLAPQLKTPSFN